MGGERGTPYNGIYREAPPKRGIFFRLQENERVRISLVEEYTKGYGNLSFGSVIGLKRANREFYGFIKSRKRSVL